MDTYKSAGGVVLNEKGEVLIVNQNSDSWSFPKGHLEPGESNLEAAIREIREESGVSDLELVKELGTYERHPIAHGGIGEDVSMLKSITLFLFRSNQQDLHPEDPDNPEARWVSVSDAMKLLTHPKDKDFLDSKQSILAQSM